LRGDPLNLIRVMPAKGLDTYEASSSPRIVGHAASSGFFSRAHAWPRVSAPQHL